MLGAENDEPEMSFRRGNQQGGQLTYSSPLSGVLTLLHGKFCRLGLRRTFPCGEQRRCSVIRRIGG
jgi:hypothetical protein